VVLGSSCLGVPVRQRPLKEVLLVVRNSTVLALDHAACVFDWRKSASTTNAPKVQPGLRIEANGSILHGKFRLLGLATEDKTPEATEELVAFLRASRWKEGVNLLGPARPFLSDGGKPYPADRPVLFPDDWKTFWNSESVPGIVGEPRFTGGDVMSLKPEARSSLTAAAFRLADDSPGKGKGEGGKDLGADVDLVGPGAAYEKWRKSKEYETWRKESDELLSRAASPFVILAQDKRAETWYPTLADAVKAAQSGDTIEIRGDGPFESGPVDLGNKALSLRASAGARPTLRFVSADERKYARFIQTKAPLSLEGLEFDRAGDASKQIAYLIDSTDQPLRMANCRLIHGLNTLAVIGDKVEIVNCLICGSASASLTGILNRDGYLHVANSCLFGAPFELGNPGGGIASRTIRLDNSTVVSGRHLYRPALVDPEGLKKVEAKGQVVFETSRSYVYLAHKERAGMMTIVLREQDLPDADVLGLWRGLFRWSESSNLYNFKCGYGEIVATIGEKAGPHRVPLPDLEKWHGFWKVTDSKSSEGAAVFENGDRVHQHFHKIALDASALAALKPADFRLAPGSPGKGKGEGGRDIGADVDLVGPGEAYEKWKKTREYQEWRKQTDSLMTAP
jgi:hypothetical protein